MKDEAGHRARSYSFLLHPASFILVLAVFLRFFRIGHESLWFDEGWTWWMTGLSPGQMADVIRNDVVGPASFYLLKAWRVLIGEPVTEVGLRTPAAVCMTLTLVPFFILTRSALQTRLAQGVACLLMAGSFMQLQYAREARMYALLCLMAVSALACVPTLASRRSWPAIIAFAVLATGGLYTHNMMLFSGVGLAAAWLCWPGGRRLRDRFLDMGAAGAIVAVLYAPWLPILKQQTDSITGTFWAARPDGRAVSVAVTAVAGVDVYAIPASVWEWFNKSFTAEWAGATVIASLLVVIAVGLVEPAKRRIAGAVASFIFVPIGLVFGISQVSTPVFMERAFIASSALTPILLALAIDGGRRWQRIVGGVAVLAIGTLAGISTHRLFTAEQKENWRGAYHALAELPSSPTRLIVLVANEGQLPFDFYATNDPNRTVEPRTGAPAGFFSVYPPRTIRQVKEDRDLDALRTQLIGKDEVFLVLSHDNFSDPDGLTEAFLSEWGTRVDERTFRGIRVVRFAKNI